RFPTIETFSIVCAKLGCQSDGQSLLHMMLWMVFPPARKCHWSDRRWGGRGYGEPSMQAITTVGLDIAKSVFQVHGVSATREVIIRHQLKRRHVLPFFQRPPPCVVGMEACATSHHWSREIGGHLRSRPA